MFPHRAQSGANRSRKTLVHRTSCPTCEKTVFYRSLVFSLDPPKEGENEFALSFWGNLMCYVFLSEL